MPSTELFILGLALFLVGLLLIALAVLRVGVGSGRGFTIILLGPIPIVFGSRGRMAILIPLIIVIAIVLFFASLVLQP